MGGGAPISVQSMTKTDTRDVSATSRRIERLAAAGCEIIRVAVPDREAAEALRSICSLSPLPVIADIHFDYRLALTAAAAGCAGLRINPGNIGADWKVGEVIKACRERMIPIRVGVNVGSLPSDLRAQSGISLPEALVKSALREVAFIEKRGYREIKISVKAFDVFTTRTAYRLLSRKVDYPLHLGVTEAGPPFSGTIRSVIGIGALLMEGIGDTIRVSLTGPEEEEIRVGREILKVLGLRTFGPTIISCPTCGRCRIDIFSLVKEVEEKISGLPSAITGGLTVAVMGCEVNGPEEARRADIGLAGAGDKVVLFKNGSILRRVPFRRAAAALLEELRGE